MGGYEGLRRRLGDAAVEVRMRVARGVRAALAPLDPPGAATTAAPDPHLPLELRALLDMLPDLVLIHRDGFLVWANTALVTALEYERREDVIGRPLIELVPPDYHGAFRRRMESVRRGDAHERPEAAFLTRTGRTVLAEVWRPREITFGGGPARMLVGRDLTERLRLQQRLITADRLAALGMLAAGVAHEVNNPLAYVLNNIELASRDLASLGDPAARSRAALDVALEGVDRIRAIVRQLLLLTRSDDGATQIIDVRAVVASTLALAAGEVEQRAQLECIYEPVPPARGTEARLGQVILNLVVNALEAMKNGTPEANRLRVTVRPGPPDQVFVEITDNGTGVDPDHITRIFDPFFTTKAQGEGTGLGLSISQQLMAEIGGELTHESRAAAGATFRIRLATATTTKVDDAGPPAAASLVDGG